MIRILRAAIWAGAFMAAGSAAAAGSDELWEVTTQMNMAGMPPGMGAHTSQVCSEKGDAKKAMTPPGEKCKVNSYKESGNRITVTVSCPEGNAVIENTYNAARTEYKGTMKMTSREGDMTMTMAGRKIGSCDAKQQRAQQEAKVGAAKQQAEKAQADMAAMYAKQSADQIAGCQAAVDTMDSRKLGVFADCGNAGGYCEAVKQQEHMKAAATKCTASRTEYCKRYQTMDGFLKAKGDEQGAAMCKVSTDQLKASFCPRAQQANNLAFLGHFCPVEAKPLAQQHCVGRTYTSRARDQWSDFCEAYLAHNSLDEPERSRPAAARSGTVDTKEAVQQGINKLRGLLGR